MGMAADPQSRAHRASVHRQQTHPARVSFANGYIPMGDAKEIVRQKGKGAAHPFTREF